MLTPATAAQRDSANELTKQWLRRAPAKTLSDALESVQQDSVWTERQREHFWIPHVQMHDALFNDDYIPELSRILGCEESNLRKVHSLSKKTKNAERWIRDRRASEEAELAERAWLLSAIVRGRFHEYFASESGLHLVAHPLGQFVSMGLDSQAGPMRKPTNSKKFFVNAIIGSALIQSGRRDGRVRTWVENLVKARSGGNRFKFPEMSCRKDAEEHAALVAHQLRITESSALARRAIDYVAAIGVSVTGLVAVGIAPWLSLATIPAGPAATLSYRYIFDESVGDTFSRVVWRTRRRFRKLGRQAAGRIERYLE